MATVTQQPSSSRTSSRPSPSCPPVPHLLRVPVQGRIRLGQFLKLADLVRDGAQARAAVQAGDVTVNAVTETRRGHHLDDGDVVVVDLPSGPVAAVVEVSAAGTPAPAGP
ncbi:RNA-binding S4 domain-containing protein [Actinomyces lilanjuaniae]|uniref:RNA-binding S4 domain-containing protein n=1 Tax=Actinomyces lilanjuaniae TaxID=2321394 RepID=A0ABM6Z650_9ACTO|nr:RNA-binding S4 domain-containing protein [Actinomyces lilanjuaniae]